VRASPSGLPTAFSLQPVRELEALGMDLAEDDVLHNLVTRESQHMRGGYSQDQDITFWTY
jgi:hypothetical protein